MGDVSDAVEQSPRDCCVGVNKLDSSHIYFTAEHHTKRLLVTMKLNDNNGKCKQPEATVHSKRTTRCNLMWFCLFILLRQSESPEKVKRINETF